MEPFLGEQKPCSTTLFLGNPSRGWSLILGGKLATETHPQED